MPRKLNNQDIMVSQGWRAQAFQKLVHERPDFFEQVTNYCLLGADDTQLGAFFGVEKDTIMYWRKHSPEFADAQDNGRHVADAQVVSAMFKRAVGYEYPSQRLVINKGRGTVVTLVEHVPPDVGAGKYWLDNRQGQKWTDSKQRIPDVPPPPDTSITVNFIAPGQPTKSITVEAADIIDVTPDR